MKRYLIACAAFVSALGVSCNRDDATGGIVPGSGDQVEASFTLQLPASRSETEATLQENHIENIIVLAFRVNQSTGEEEYDYMSSAISITDVTPNGRYKQVVVPLNKRDYKQTFVIIANAAGPARRIADSADGMLKDDLLEKLEFANSNAWHTTSGNFVALPMWGEAAGKTINDSNKDIGPVKLVRMVARIDVEFSSSQASSKFVLNSIHVYNRHDKGRVVPDCSSACWNAEDYKVLAVTMPSQDIAKVRGPHDISLDAVTKTLPSVYLFEADRKDLNAPLDATCVVLGGFYDGSDTPTFYRIDFYEKDDGGTLTGYRELMRNYIYLVRIAAVTGEGHKTPDEAFESQSVNMTVEVKDWEPGDISDVVTDQQYMLGVSQSEFTIPYSAGTYELNVITDYPAGWNASIQSNSPWITKLEGGFTTPELKERLSFTVDENTTDSERTGYITVTAGRMTIVLKIVQEAGMSAITVGGSNCYILKPGGDAIKFPVAWANNLKTRFSPGDEIKLEIIWLDANTGVGKSNSIIDSYSVIGSGAGAEIMVAPGSKQGNALIAAKVNENIRWSWHIWVVDYDGSTMNFNGYDWMQLNVGALDNSPRSLTGPGLLYQWGRKDPFPGLANLFASAPTPVTLYNEDGHVVNIGKISVKDSPDNLEPSILSPTTLYYGGQNVDWYGNGIKDTSLWGVSKTQYDPCPFGWKIPGKDASWNYASGTWSSTNLGMTFPDLGYHPATGKIEGTTGEYTLGTSFTQGFYWSGYGGADYNLGSYAFETKSYGADYNWHQRANAYAVRCVKN